MGLVGRIIALCHSEVRPAAQRNSRAAAVLAAAFTALAALPAAADEAPTEAAKPIRLGLVYKLDAMDVAGGGLQRGVRALDNLSLNLDADLDAAAGWRGATIHISALANHGGQPGAMAGAIQGVDNIEVVHQRAKIYEAWFDQALAGGSADLRLGLYDTNSEFNVTDTSGLFLAPTYGVSSEISATGPAGPSIFPSTALGARLNLQPRKDVYVRLAAVDAQAGTLGDPGGVDIRFGDGLILFAETGWTGRGKVALGAWTYTRGQPDVRDVLPSGDPKLSAAHGAYLLVDQPLRWGDSGPQVSGFFRLGVSDGDTGPFGAAASMGLVAGRLVPGRPDGVLGVGLAAGWLGAKFRAGSADAGAPLAAAETSIELTYADKLGSHLTLQPDLQYVHRPSGDPTIADALVLGLRATVTY